MMLGPSTAAPSVATGSRSISSSTDWRVGRTAATVALNGRALKGWSAAGLMAMAVTFDREPASPASCTSRANRCRGARRKEHHGVECACLDRGACRIRQRGRPRAPRRAPRGAPRNRPGRGSPRNPGRCRRRTRGEGARPSDRGVGARDRPAHRRRPTADVTETKPSPSAVEAVVSPTARIGLPRCSLASARARAPLALLSRTAWHSNRSVGEVGGRMQDLETEQRRNDGDMAALGQRRRQRGRLAFRPGDQHAHHASVAGASARRRTLS